MNFPTCLLTFCTILCVTGLSIDHPKCPVKYIYVGSKSAWRAIGHARIDSGNQNVTLDVEFATAELNDIAFLGSMKLLDFHQLRTPSNEEKWNIIYEVLFPVQDPLPHITKIKLNGEVLCEDHEQAHTDFQPDIVKLHMEYHDNVEKQRLTTELLKRPEE